MNKDRSKSLPADFSPHNHSLINGICLRPKQNKDINTRFGTWLFCGILILNTIFLNRININSHCRIVSCCAGPSPKSLIKRAKVIWCLGFSGSPRSKCYIFIPLVIFFVFWWKLYKFGTWLLCFLPSLLWLPFLEEKFRYHLRVQLAKHFKQNLPILGFPFLKFLLWKFKYTIKFLVGL